MNRRDSESLDRHLTGDWGEGSVPDDDDPVADAVDRERWTGGAIAGQLVVVVKRDGWTAKSDTMARWLAEIYDVPLAEVRAGVESIAWRTP